MGSGFILINGRDRVRNGVLLRKRFHRPLVVCQLPSDGRISRSQNSRITAPHFEHGNLRLPTSRNLPIGAISFWEAPRLAICRSPHSERPALGILRSVLTRRTKLDAPLGRSSPGVCEEG